MWPVAKHGPPTMGFRRAIAGLCREAGDRVREASLAHLGVMSRRLALQRSATWRGGEAARPFAGARRREGFSGPAQRVEPAYRVGGENFHCRRPILPLEHNDGNNGDRSDVTDPTLFVEQPSKLRPAKPIKPVHPASRLRTSQHFCLLDGVARNRKVSVSALRQHPQERAHRPAPIP